MRGYVGRAKSARADAAERGGSFPASVLARRYGVSTAAIRAVVPNDGWHHTAAAMRRTQYYDEVDVIERLDVLRAWTPPPPDEILTDVIGWIETTGRRGRVFRRIDGATIERRGNALTIHLADGTRIERDRWASAGALFVVSHTKTEAA